MPRFEPVDPNQAEGKQKELLGKVKQKFGKVPNIIASMAQSPAAVQAYMSFKQALGEGQFSAKEQEQIALAISGVNRCDYCVSAHTAAGKSHKADEDELARNTAGESADDKLGAALAFVKKVTENRGQVDDEDVQAVRDAGYDDGAIVELIAMVAINIFTNYFNHINQTEVDFPKVDLEQLVGK